MLAVSSQYLSGPDMLTLVEKAVLVVEQLSTTTLLRHQVRYAPGVHQYQLELNSTPSRATKELCREP